MNNFISKEWVKDLTKKCLGKVDTKILDLYCIASAGATSTGVATIDFTIHKNCYVLVHTSTDNAQAVANKTATYTCTTESEKIFSVYKECNTITSGYGGVGYFEIYKMKVGETLTASIQAVSGNSYVRSTICAYVIYNLDNMKNIELIEEFTQAGNQSSVGVTWTAPEDCYIVRLMTGMSNYSNSYACTFANRPMNVINLRNISNQLIISMKYISYDLFKIQKGFTFISTCRNSGSSYSSHTSLCLKFTTK